MPEPQAPYRTPAAGTPTPRLLPETLADIHAADADARQRGVYEYTIEVKVTAPGTPDERQSVYLKLETGSHRPPKQP